MLSRAVHVAERNHFTTTTILPLPTPFGAGVPLYPASMLRVIFSTPEQATWTSVTTKDIRGPWVLSFEELVEFGA